MRLVRPVLWLVFAATLALGASCSQGEGDRCEVYWDCGDGLQCCTGSRTCQKTCTTAQHDAAVQPDVATQQDAAASADASPT